MRPPFFSDLYGGGSGGWRWRKIGSPNWEPGTEEEEERWREERERRRNEGMGDGGNGGRMQKKEGKE